MNSKQRDEEGGTNTSNFNQDDILPKSGIPILMSENIQIDGSIIKQDDNIKNHDTNSSSLTSIKYKDPEDTESLISELEEAAKELKRLESFLQELNTNEKECGTTDLPIPQRLASKLGVDIHTSVETSLSQSTQTDFINTFTIGPYETQDSLLNKKSLELVTIDLRKKLENLESRFVKFKPLNEESKSEIIPSSDIIHNNEERTEENNDGFPLTRSPLLNTPPYETIILTEHNEARLRIYLNQRLHQCFQQEVALLHEKLSTTIENSTNNNIQFDKSHNNNNNSHNISSISSTATLVPCFDPSEVDLEIKEIFTENPPVTHKIVRRKLRKERGSSVPAIDSFYGTKDIAKVGHASYFIPSLTPSERKCIGWRSEYHYGRWKYKQPIVPKCGSGLPLHPMKSFHDSHKSTVKCDGFSSIPNLGTLSECSSSLIAPLAPNDENGEEDCLSFITLSDSNRPSVTPNCRIIPETLTVRKFVRWIAPCFFKDRVNASASVVIHERPESVQEFDEAIEKCKFKGEDISENGDKKKKHHHHHHIHFNIFGSYSRQRKSICSETSSIVTGGDILLSNADSVNFGALALDNVKPTPMDTDPENPIDDTELYVSQYKICDAEDHQITRIVIVGKDVSDNSHLIPAGKKELKMDDDNNSKAVSGLEISVVQEDRKMFPYNDDIPSESPFLTPEEMVFNDSGSDSSDDESDNHRDPKLSVLSMMIHPTNRIKILRSKGQHKIITLNCLNSEQSLHEDVVTNITEQPDIPFQPDPETSTNGNNIIGATAGTMLLENTDKDADIVELDTLKSKLNEMHTFTQDFAAYLNFQSHRLKTKTKKKKLEIQETRFLDAKDLVIESLRNRHQEYESASSFWNASDDISSIDTTTTNGSEEIFSDTESSNSIGPASSSKGTKFASPAVPLKICKGAWLHQLISDQCSSRSSQRSNYFEENSN